ncbi:MAG: DUF4358 domain-containing protein [Firmicutes bacterium]|nr:DUF4358 domain-containing protein [Bacillota bacterium]
MKKILSLILIVTTVFSFVGCSKKTELNVKVKDILDDIKGEIAKDMKDKGVKEESLKDGKLPGFMDIDLTKEKNPFSEIFSKEDIKEGYILQQMMNVKSDLIIVLKAKDESKVKDLKTSLEKIKKGQVNTWEKYLPDQYKKVQNNIIKTKGKYLVYITYDNPEKIEKIFNNSLK